MGKIYRAIRPMFETNRWRIFPGDMVYVNHGPCKGQTGRVLQVLKDKRVPQVVVEGVNLRKKKLENMRDVDNPMVVTIEAPIHYSQVSLLEPETGEAGAARSPSQRWVKAKFRYLADGTRVRVGAGRNSTGAIIPIPPPPGGAASKKLGEGGMKDSKATEVLQDTYQSRTQEAGFRKWLQAIKAAQPQGPLNKHAAARSSTAGSTDASTGTVQYSTCTQQQLMTPLWRHFSSQQSARLRQQHCMLAQPPRSLHVLGGKCHTHWQPVFLSPVAAVAASHIAHIASSSLAVQAALLQQDALVPDTGGVF